MEEMKNFMIITSLKSRAKELKKEILALYFAYRDPRLKLLPKLIIIFTVAYALSPIDLIPDFIPVLGYLDDLIILPLLISLSIKLIPKEIIDESREKADTQDQKLKPNMLIGVLFILIWVLILFIIVKAIVGLIK
jgi:uncharacterized membrane protein YkvA (DUF1232 family)